MRRAAIITLLALVVASGATASGRPWIWTPAQASSAILQSKPALSSDSMTAVRCFGKKGVSFRCATTFTPLSLREKPYRKTLYAKVRQTSKPMICVNFKPAIPTGCLSKNGAPRVLGSFQDAFSAGRKPGQGYSEYSCTGYGAGFYICTWTQTDGVSGKTQITFTTKGVVKR